VGAAQQSPSGARGVVGSTAAKRIQRLRIELAGVERVDEVREPWLELHDHHCVVVGTLPLVSDDEASWERRRALYVDRLSPGGGFLVFARLAPDQAAWVSRR